MVSQHWFRWWLGAARQQAIHNELNDLNDWKFYIGLYLQEDVTPHPAGIKLRRPGYFTIPSLEELADMVGEDGHCIVKDFGVGREGYGNVYFPGETDITGLDLDAIGEWWSFMHLNYWEKNE